MPITPIPRVRAFVEPMPAMACEQVGCLGVIVAMAATSPDDPFPGGTIYDSIDGGTTFHEFHSSLVGAVGGQVVGTLSGTTSARFWDRVTTVDVELFHADHELESVAEDEVAAGRRNWMLIGKEVVGFATATLVGTRTYRLSNLLRGRRGTELWMTRHAANEACLLLTGPGVEFKKLGLGAHGQIRLFKAVAAGQAESDVSETFELVVTGDSVRPMAPVILPAVRDGAGDLTIRLNRRSRTPFRLLGGVRAPAEESTKQYEVRIYDGGGNLVRTLTGTAGSDEVVYTAAQQTTDFGSPQSSVDVEADQISDTVGRGHTAEGTV